MSWKRVNIGSITKIVTKGTTPTSIGYNFSEQGIPFLRVNNIQSNNLNVDDVLFINQDTDNALKRSRIQPRDILLSIAGTIGKTAVVPTNAPIMNCNQAVAIIRLKENISPYYVNYWLNTNDAFRQITGSKVTATISNLSLSCIKDIKIPLPPLNEQKRIAAILDKADEIRRKRKEAIRLTDELLRSVFLDMFGDPITNPKGWEVIGISKIIQGDMRNGLSPSNNGKFKGSVLTLSAITQGKFNINSRKFGHFDVEPPSEKKVYSSLFLVCRGNGNINLVGCGRFPDKDYQDILFPDTMIAVPLDFSIVEKSFLEYLWNSQFVRLQIEKQARTTNGTHKINQKSLSGISILLPPMELQKKFTGICSRIQSLRDSYPMNKLNDLFNSLMQRAFKGEL